MRDSCSVFRRLALLRLSLSLVSPNKRHLSASKAVGSRPLLLKAVFGLVSSGESCRQVHVGTADKSSPLVKAGPEQVGLAGYSAVYFSVPSCYFHLA